MNAWQLSSVIDLRPHQNMVDAQSNHVHEETYICMYVCLYNKCILRREKHEHFEHVYKMMYMRETDILVRCNVINSL